MTAKASGLIEHFKTLAEGFGSSPLLVRPDYTIVALSAGYIPLLTNFSREDRAAKGLRRRTADDEPEPPIHFSALELVREHDILLLTGTTGSGKTTFAKYLCFGLATGRFDQPRLIPRNDMGDLYAEVWHTTDVIPCYFDIKSVAGLQDVVDRMVPDLILTRSAKNGGNCQLVLEVDVSKQHVSSVCALLTSLIDRVKASSGLKLLILSDTRSSQRYELPTDVARFELLPLLQAQRRQALPPLLGVEEVQITIATGEATSNPALFALAMEADNRGYDVVDLVNAWLVKHATERRDSSSIAAQAFSQYASSAATERGSFENDLPLLARNRAVQQLLSACHLAQSPPEMILDLHRQGPCIWEQVIRSLLTCFAQPENRDVIIAGLTEDSYPGSQRNTLLVAESVVALPDDITSRVKTSMLQTIYEAGLPPADRKSAGRVLSKLGDPRDLEELTAVEGGLFPFGSESHFNSRPSSLTKVESFQIGLYPVVNQAYLRFIEETGRPWRSTDGTSVGKQNVPATDLTWHDARAYCLWLTHRWRNTGKIKSDELVRLPTEVEWERASRGDLQESFGADPVWPWGWSWKTNTANFEETGFNEPCAVGLFPSGRSPYGCYDMSGQVWEWCSTLWGENMSAPTFRYPYHTGDGREEPNAPEAVRRVLRGGCFSSGRSKISSSYRGSLEPTGSWRGNGFRVVVVRGN